MLARPAGPWVMWPGAAGPCYSGSRCFIGISVGLALVEGLPAAGWATWVPDRSMWAPSVERGGGGIKKSGRVSNPACWSVGHVARGRRAVLFRIALLHRHLRWSGVGGGVARSRLGHLGSRSVNVGSVRGTRRRWYRKVRPGCSPGLLVRGLCGPGPRGRLQPDCRTGPVGPVPLVRTLLVDARVRLRRVSLLRREEVELLGVHNVG